ncbi:MOSC domain-containing protein [Thiocapsa sp.]|uniref:MOSC domain-containing protein n=1 Tax=Thiocapsa sp. TaxID=2024551 RepID=UPI0025D8DB04|nr:MOSC domain-containing protein [Thiocapsa sp.]
MESLSDLIARFPHPGEVAWIGRRPARRADVIPCAKVTALVGRGLEGDHYAGRSGSRGVTLVQAEHLAVVGALLRRDPIDPALLRRNLVVSGVNLLALKGQRFRIGTVVLEGTGPCPPCSRMEETLGPGGYNAMRGHAGLNARVVTGGIIRLGDAVVPLLAEIDPEETFPQ